MRSPQVSWIGGASPYNPQIITTSTTRMLSIDTGPLPHCQALPNMHRHFAMPCPLDDGQEIRDARRRARRRGRL